MKKLLFTGFLICLFSIFLLQQVIAQEFVSGGKNNFHWKLIGRVFFDGGVLNRDSTVTSFQVNDLRLGTVIRFEEHWETKIELGYGDSKNSLKDIYLNYSIAKHNIRLGYHYEPFGNARVGTTNYRFITDAPSDKALGNKRKLGISYSYNQPWINVVAGVFSDGDIEKSKPLNRGYSLAAKVTGRPLMEDKKLIHIGIAPRFNSSDQQISFSCGSPTDLLSKSDNTLIEARIDQVINQWKLDLELIMLYNKWYFQGQYFLAHLNRFATENYNAKGGYAQIGYMILGAKHNYNPETGMIVNPAPKSLEILLRYDNTNLNDASIQGGRITDISLGMNYFINKFVAAKINYTRMLPGKTALSGNQEFDIIQARLQFSF